MSFPTDPLDIRIEAALGADLTQDPSTWEWTDLGALGDGVYDEDDLIFEDDDIVTEGWGRLLSQTLQIRRGRADESSRTQPASVSFVLDNRDGWLTPGNPMSPFYGRWRRGVPLRIVVPAGGDRGMVVPGGYRRGFSSGVSTDDIPGLTGDLDLRFDGAINWQDDAPFMRRWEEAGSVFGFWVYRGQLRLYVWDASTDSQRSVFSEERVPWGHGERGAVRVVLDVDNGAGGHDCAFFTAPTIDGPWEPLGPTHTFSGAMALPATALPVRVGHSNYATSPHQGIVGKVYAAEVRDSSGVLASLDFTALPEGREPFDDQQGNTWTFDGAAEVIDAVRFWGEVSAIEPQWPWGDLADGDHPGESRVVVTASGPLRRLGAGRQLGSTLRRAVARARNRVIGYWPMEDGESATVFASELPGGSPMSQRGATMGGDSSLLASEPLPTWQAGTVGAWSAPVPRGAGSDWVVSAFVRLPGFPPASDITLLDIGCSSGSVSRWRVWVGATTGGQQAFNHAGDLVLNRVGLNNFWNQDWVQVSLRVRQQASNIRWSIRWDLLDGSVFVDDDVFAGTVGEPSRVRADFTAPTGGISFGHVAVASGFANNWIVWAEGPSDAWRGELAGSRVRRLLTEEAVLGAVDHRHGTPLGPQRPSGLLPLLSEAQDADMGFLGELVDLPGVRYAARPYNAAALVLDAGANEIAVPFAPTFDDQRLANDVEVRRLDGSSARVTDEASIAAEEVHDTSVSLNLASDSQLIQQAGWRLHLGTWPGMRYPTVTVDLAVAPHLIPEVTKLREGDRIQVVNLPAQHPTMADLLVEGITETISPHGWTFEFTCSPAGPWTVGVVEDNTLGRADTAGCVLTDDVDAEETTWLLDTTVGPEWITTASHPDEFPFDLEAGGEVVTVTAITGTGPQTATVVRAVNGVRKSHAAGTPVSLAHPAVAAL